MLSMSSAQLASSENQSAGVVYSSDQNPRKAEQEIEQLPRRLPQYRDRVGLFKRRNWYVSVVLFGSSLLGMVRYGGINRLNPYLARDLID